MFPFTEMYLKYVHLSDSFNHSLPEMMYLWWLQVVWCVATLLHSWKWCFNLFSANHELNIPWIYVVYTMNVCWFLSWIQFGYVSGWGVLFGPQNITLKSKKRTPHFETSLYVEISFFTRNFESRLYHFLFFVILMKLFWTFDEQ